MISNSSDDTLAKEKGQREEDQLRPLYAPQKPQSRQELLQAKQRRARKWLGLDPERPLKPHEKGSEKYFWSRIRTTAQEPFSEFLGTFVLSCFYMGGIAQSSLGATISTAPGGFGYGSFMSVPWWCVVIFDANAQSKLTRRQHRYRCHAGNLHCW